MDGTESYMDALPMYKKAEECNRNNGQPLGETMLKLIGEKRVDAVDRKSGNENQEVK